MLHFILNSPFLPVICVSGHRKSLTTASCEIEWPLFLCYIVYFSQNTSFLLKKILHPFKCLATFPLPGLLTFKPKHLEHKNPMMCAKFFIYFRQITYTTSPLPSYSILSSKERKHICQVLYILVKSTQIFQYNDFSLYQDWK